MATTEETPLTARGLRDRRTRWVRAIAFFVAVAFACSLLAISCRRPETSSRYFEEHKADMPSLSSTWTCDTIDSSQVNPEFCSSPDGRMCKKSCLPADSWCKYFCGDACSRGVGGLCVFQHLAHLEETCAIVAANSDLRNQHPPDLSRYVPTEVDSVPILSCDYHAYCTYCSGSDTCSQVVAKPYPPYTAAGFAAEALNSVELFCDRFARLENGTVHKRMP